MDRLLTKLLLWERMKIQLIWVELKRQAQMTTVIENNIKIIYN